MKKWFMTHSRIIGWGIVIINGVCILNAAFYFLVTAHFPLYAWICFNACTPSILIFIIGFILKRNSVMAASLPFLCFFGVSGMFVFGWSGTSIYAQIGHIFMTIAVVYILLILYLAKDRRAVRGIVIGAVFFAAFLPFQQHCVKSHPELIKMLGDPSFEKMMNDGDDIDNR